MSIELTDEQTTLLENLHKWFKMQNNQYYSYSGSPGTGKTTIIKILIERLGLEPYNVISVAYTGKATLQLLMNGMNAMTIHSLIYKPVFVPLIEDGKPVLKADGSVKKVLAFVLKDELPPSLKLIIVDEWSMVSDPMLLDILSFGLPVVFIGDKNQLPPVMGDNTIITEPDFTLTKIMRQAEGDPIIYISQCILHDKPIFAGPYGNSNIYESMDMGNNLLNDYDIIICGKNKLREEINTHIRYGLLGRDGIIPEPGDKMICKQNDWGRSIFNEKLNSNIYVTNGLIGYIEDVDYSSNNGKRLNVDFRPEFMDEPFLNLDLDIKYLRMDLEDRLKYGMSKNTKFEYGYAITAHGSQGSQFPSVLYFDQPFFDRETLRKLRYTAATRAMNKLDIVLSRGKYLY